ncbi:MAG: hypothetical protein JWN40_1551 [Phycisphaerales bacterium]|nr:hypothetical protein [Phycisphaerales bacterium]
MKRLAMIPVLALLTAIWIGTHAPRPLPPRVPTTPDLGINLDVIEDWSTAAPFIDATAMLRKWGKAGAAWVDDPAIKLTPDNCPLSDADALTSLRGYPAGVYTLRYEGTASVSLSGFSASEVTPSRRVGAVTTAQVRLTPRAGDLLIIKVRGVNAADPLRKLQLLAPGYADATAVFTDAFVRRVRVFSTIRFMDWQRTNGSAAREWADRPLASAVGRTGVGGVPVEEIVALGNATGRGVWVNLPHLASDDYVRQFATVMRNGLHAGAIVRFEYSNEVWNRQFEQARANMAAAKANATLTARDDVGRAAQQAAARLAHFAGIFREVYGDAAYAARVRPVVGGCCAAPYWAQTQLEWLKVHHPDLAVELAIAAYFGGEDDIADVDRPGVSADVLFDRINQRMDSGLAAGVAAHAALATRFGVPLVGYEGGAHLTATNGMNEALKVRMQNDRRMAETYRHMMTIWTRNGGGPLAHYAFCGPHGKFGCWGLLESADQVGSVRWDTCMALQLPAGDANLDGKVDAADLAIVKANLGRDRAWWTEGDFNRDGRVDAADLALLEANMKATMQPASAAGERGR